MVEKWRWPDSCYYHFLNPPCPAGEGNFSGGHDEV